MVFTRVVRELFPYIVLVQDKVLFTSKVSASSSPLLFRGWWVRPVGQVVQVIPIRRVWTVNVVVPVADPELLVEAGVVAAHVGDPPPVLVAHVEDHTVKLEVSIEPDWAVSAVEGEGDIRHIRPPTLLKNNLHQCFLLQWEFIGGRCVTSLSFAASQIRCVAESEICEKLVKSSSAWMALLWATGAEHETCQLFHLAKLMCVLF